MDSCSTIKGNEGVGGLQAAIAARPALLQELLRDAQGVGLTVSANVQSGIELFQTMEQTRPDVLIVDVDFERRYGGIDLARSEKIPRATPIILISDFLDAGEIPRVIQAGAAGILVRPYATAQFHASLCVALGGRQTKLLEIHRDLQQTCTTLMCISRQLGELESIAPVVPLGPCLRSLPELALLSPREWDVLRGLADHKRVPILARDMHISPHTVRNHLKSIFGKLSVHSQAELLDKVVERAPLRSVSTAAAASG